MNTYPDIQLYIGGKWQGSKDHLPILNPADEKQIGLLPIASNPQLDDALDAAYRGF